MHLPSTMSSMKNNSEDEGAPMEEHQTQKAEFAGGEAFRDKTGCRCLCSIHGYAVEEGT